MKPKKRDSTKEERPPTRLPYIATATLRSLRRETQSAGAKKPKIYFTKRRRAQLQKIGAEVLAKQFKVAILPEEMLIKRVAVIGGFFFVFESKKTDLLNERHYYRFMAQDVLIKGVIEPEKKSNLKSSNFNVQLKK